jgi:type II secretory pathway pseudopilin PulG
MKLNFRIWFKKITQSGRRPGIGLVESLVAISIMGIGVTALVTDISAGSIAVTTQSEATIAQSLAQTQMEVTKAAPYDPAGSTYASIPAPDGYQVIVEADPGIFKDKNIQKITVAIIHDTETVLILEGYKVKQ